MCYKKSEELEKNTKNIRKDLFKTNITVSIRLHFLNN